MRRDLLPCMAIAERQSFKQRLHHRPRKPRRCGRCGFNHVFTASNEMAQTRLVKCMGEPIVGLPAIMVEESRVVLSQYRGGLSKSTSRQNGIQGDFVTHANPEPLQMGSHSPARLIEPIDQTVTHGALKFLVGRFCFLAQSRQRTEKRASAPFQTITPFQTASRR